MISFKEFKLLESVDEEQAVIDKLTSLGFVVTQNDSKYFGLTVSKDAPPAVKKLYGSKKLNYPNIDQVKRFISALPREVTKGKK